MSARQQTFSLQPPRIQLSADAAVILDRVERIYASQEMPLSDLFGTWRPEGSDKQYKAWGNKRVWKAIEEAVEAGAIRQVEGAYGTVLVLPNNTKPWITGTTYTFYDESDNIIVEVNASSHDEAIEKAGTGITFQTDFASSPIWGAAA